MASLSNATDEYAPSVIKSCSRCRSRKVKCDLKIPHCSACERHGEACNITEYVAYPYSVVEKLHARVQELEQRLHASQSTSLALNPNHNSRSSNQQDSTGAWSADVTKEAEEVGVLAIGFQDPYSQAKYVGAAAGSTFARIFFKQIGLDASTNSVTSRDNHNDEFMTSKAALPPRSIASSLLPVYIARVQTWWPILHLQHMRSFLQRMYQAPRDCTDHDKFLCFIFLALASNEAQFENESPAIMDLNSPKEYFNTALHFFGRFGNNPRDFKGLQAVTLISIWMLNTHSCSNSNDLWQITRYAMSVAIELGIHRHNPSWNFSQEELEIRGRTWWTIYSLERLVALNTGRVLSVRDQAIDMPIPSFSSIDHLTTQEAKVADIFHSKSIQLFIRMIELRKISGQILESIYIARKRNGHCSSLSFRELCSISDELHHKLEKWKVEFDATGIQGSREYSLMKIEYCILLLHLNRPSPSFMIPSQNMITICSQASSYCLYEWTHLAGEHGITAICRCYRHFHDILMVGLVRLYCDWHLQKVTPNATATLRSEDAALCRSLLEQCVVGLRDSSLSKFLSLFCNLQSKVYHYLNISTSTMDVDQTDPSIQSTGMHMSPLNHQAGIMTDTANPLNPPSRNVTDLPFGSDGLETYLTQVSNIFDNETMDTDEMLSAWYGSLLEDVGDSGIGPNATI